jgi:hypothetical protein
MLPINFERPEPDPAPAAGVGTARIPIRPLGCPAGPRPQRRQQAATGVGAGAHPQGPLGREGPLFRKGRPPEMRQGVPTGLGGGSAAAPPQISESSWFRHEYLWSPPLDRATVVASNRRHQRWTTRHPIRFQECADRRPLLQQSSSDLSVSRSPSGSPNAPSKVPRVHRNRSPGCHGPRCRFPQLRPPTHPLIVQRSRTADDSLMVTAWRHGLRAPRPAATRHHPSSALIGPSSPQLSPIPRARSQQGSGFSMGQIRFTTPQDPAAERPAPR